MLERQIEATDKALLEIKEFGYHGVNFSVSRPQFLEILPKAIALDDPDAAIGASLYNVPDREVDLVGFRFLDDRLVRLHYFYKSKSVDRYGGSDGLIERAKKRFGPPTEKLGAFTFWKFPTIDRLIVVMATDESWMLSFMRPSMEKDAENRKKSLKAGF